MNSSPFSITDILFGFVAPAVTTLVLLFVLQRVFPKPRFGRYVASLAIACGFLCGYGLLSLGPWIPDSHWHWLPYAAIAAAVVGPVASAEGVHPIERPLVYTIVAIAACWMLVPTWDDLDPSRTTYLIAMVVAIVVLASAMEVFVGRSTGSLMPLLVFATMTAGSVVLALSESLRFAQIAMAASGAWFAVSVFSFIDREAKPLVGASLLFAVLGVGAMLVGQVNSFSEVPMVSYAIVPFAPLLGWIGMLGPLSKGDGPKRLIAAMALPIVLLGVAVAMAAVASLSGGDGY